MEIEMKTRLKKVYHVLEGCRDELEEIRDEIQEVYDDLSSDEQDEEEGEELLEEIGNMESGTSDIDDVLGMLDEYTLDVPYEEDEEESSDNIRTFSMDITSQSSSDNLEKAKVTGATYKDKAKQLKKNMQVISSTFEMYNMQVMGVSCQEYGDNTGSLRVFVEVLSNESLKEQVCVKINLYDEDDDVIVTNQDTLPKKFCGIQTVEITLLDESTLDRAVKGKVYAVKW